MGGGGGGETGCEVYRLDSSISDRLGLFLTGKLGNEADRSRVCGVENQNNELEEATVKCFIALEGLAESVIFFFHVCVFFLS